jgi:hypothetical protein
MKTTTVQARKAYRAPRLQRYGSLQQLTQDVGGMGVRDGGTASGMRKTG